LFDLDALNAIHHKFHDLLDRLGGHVDAISYCPHEDQAACACRKPKPGMLLQLAERFGAEPDDVVIIGNAVSDLPAARSFGARVMLVASRGQGTDQDTFAFENLGQAVRTLLQDG
jgi:D-glycero-D-manno-heptose 1,7-bisphosphate phosphatase